MRGAPIDFQGSGVLDVQETKTDFISSKKLEKNTSCLSFEPTSVLDNKRSPNSPSSSSTLSSSVGTGGGGSADSAGVATTPVPKDEWASDLPPISAGADVDVTGGEKCVLGLEDWDSMLSGSASSPNHDQTFLRWMMGDIEDPSSGFRQFTHLGSGGGGSANEFDGGDSGFGLVDNPNFGFDPSRGANASSHAAMNSSRLTGDSSINNNDNGRLITVQNPTFSSLSNNLTCGTFYPQNQVEIPEEKPHLLYPNHVINHQQSHPPPNPTFFFPLTYGNQEQHLLLPQSRRQHFSTISNSNQDLFLQPQQPQGPQSFPHMPILSQEFHQPIPSKPKLVMGSGDESVRQLLNDQIVKISELIEAGNFVNARGILARLNHQLSPVGKPFQRVAFYFKEALQLLLNGNGNHPSPPIRRRNPSIASPQLETILKIDAYKSFSEISPLLQFANFTCNQALLEALDGFGRIHIVDFDIGLGGQWSSFMQELSLKPGGAPLLKITALSLSSSCDLLELNLTRDNLTHFANDLNIPFDFNVINVDSIDPMNLSSPLSVIFNLSENEAIAVNFPVGSPNPSAPSMIRLIKQLSPRIVVSVDRGFDRCDLSFSQNVLHSLHSCSVLLESLDAVNAKSDDLCKIERFLVQPRIDSVVLGRYCSSEKMLPWRNLFISGGFSPLPFSNFTETQAEFLVKRFQVRGFHYQKHQTSLLLCWDQRELVSASAWRC